MITSDCSFTTLLGSESHPPGTQAVHTDKLAPESEVERIFVAVLDDASAVKKMDQMAILKKLVR
ncbi:UNVERIFIED_CONTAM: hypothetical protein Slati_4517500 [Sesamum latifolium]|uniref:Uncharacterized protein n=1 Tax=Sesamum latifolium TaxID=2727402 RepID=A0AAW2SSY3_9LAMI